MNKDTYTAIAGLTIYGEPPSLLIAKDDELTTLTDAHLAKAIPDFALLDEHERAQKVRKFIDGSNCIGHAHRHRPLPNVRHTDQAIPEEATATLLGIGELFQSGVGYRILALIVAGLHTEALQEAEVDFHPVLSTSQSDKNVVRIFSAIANAAVQCKRWKGKKIKIRRTAILNFSDGRDRHFADFNLAKVKFKGFKCYRYHVQYIDTIAVIIGANGSQMREITPYIGSCTVILLDCAKGDLDPIKRPSKELTNYDPPILESLERNGENIAQLLRIWWASRENSGRWADDIVRRAKTTFGKPDSRYVAVRLDPKLLTMAISFEVLVDFFDFLSDGNYASGEDIKRYRKAAKEVFYPTPVEEIPLRRADDPAVFIEIMTQLLEKHRTKIVPQNEEYPTRGTKPLGAWRSIGDDVYLMMLEAVFIKAYPKICKATDELDCQLFDHKDWALRLQRILSEAGIIKATKRNPRYRFKLLANKEKDETYVVAVPRTLLEADESGQNPGQISENIGMPFALDVDLERERIL